MIKTSEDRRVQTVLDAFDTLGCRPSSARRMG
jgi:hypothetical protein